MEAVSSKSYSPIRAFLQSLNGWFELFGMKLPVQLWSPQPSRPLKHQTLKLFFVPAEPATSRFSQIGIGPVASSEMKSSVARKRPQRYQRQCDVKRQIGGRQTSFCSGCLFNITHGLYCDTFPRKEVYFT
jgi:hypothetical protein